MNLDFTIVLSLALVSASFSSNPLIYRINVAEPENFDHQDGNKWIGNTRNNYFRDVISRIHPDPTYNIMGRASHAECKQHPQYVQSYANVGQPGYARIPAPAPYPYPYQGGGYQAGYPMYYYYTPGTVPQQKLPQQQSQPQPQQVPNDQYLKQPVPFEKLSSTTVPPPLQPTKQPSPVSGYAPVTFPPIPTSIWQNYLCSVFPYLATCQAQTQQQTPQVSPYGYQAYPGAYQQMAQYPVYYIVQPDVKPPGAVPGGSGPVGVIKITGPSPVKPEGVNVGEKPSVEMEVDVKTGVVVVKNGEEGVKTGVEGNKTSVPEDLKDVKNGVKKTPEESAVKKPVKE